MVTPVRKIELVTQLHRALNVFRKYADDATGTELEVRLCVDIGDQNWWVNTGDVQYDTVHGDLCAAATLSTDMDHDGVVEVANWLLAEIELEYVDHEDGDDSAGASEPGRCNE